MYDVALIGGGIVGVTCALELLATGRSVALVEAGEPGAGTAGGSAGYLSDGEIFPLAKPSVVRELPALLLDSRSPLVVAPAAFPVAVVSVFTSATRVASKVARLAKRVVLAVLPTPPMMPLTKRMKAGSARRLPTTGTAR